LASNLEFLIDETEGEVIDPSTEGMTQLINDSSKPKSVESNEYSRASNELTESEPAENEVQSPIRGSLSSIILLHNLSKMKNLLYYLFIFPVQLH
jgi:hypothetical protein